MGSVHNDLHSWACRARRQGLTTIEIELEVADRAAEKIVELSNRVMDLEHELRARSSAPEAREGEAVAGAALAKAMWGIDLVPAAPSADKLLIAVEALERVGSIQSGWNKPHRIGTARQMVDDCEAIARNALADLKAEGAK